MQFHVARLLQENVGASRDFPIDEPHADLTFVNPDTAVVGSVRLTRMPHEILARGRVRVSALTTCVRCLDAIEQTLDVRFDEEFFPTIDVWTGRPVRYEADGTPDPEAQFISDDHIIDLTDTIRQSAMIAMDLNPLCRVECRGLCPQCGANRNDTGCACGQAVSASPFAVLRELNVH